VSADIFGLLDDELMVMTKSPFYEYSVPCILNTKFIAIGISFYVSKFFEVILHGETATVQIFATLRMKNRHTDPFSSSYETFKSTTHLHRD
jgi:hypothetical protein